MNLYFTELNFYQHAKSYLILSCLLISNLLYCSHDTIETIRQDPRNLKTNTTTFIYNAIPHNPSAHINPLYSTAINTFSINLLREIYKDSLLYKNIVISPFSISRNLAILTEGATGKSKVELLSALGGQTVLDDAKDALTELLYADNSIILQCTDALWINSTKYSLNPSFKETANKKFGVEYSGVDFSDTIKAAYTINEWVRKNSNNYVQCLISPSMIDSNTALLLTNTIYFEADWTSPFDVTKTQYEPFLSPNGTVYVNMMSSDYYHDTRKTESFENVKIYYGTSDVRYFYLDIYMPVTISIEEFLKNHCASALSYNDNFSIGSLKMPKIAYKSDFDLIPLLKQLGVHEIFNVNNVDLAGLVQDTESKNTNLFVNTIKHVAGIEMDEEGTKAYAASITSAGTNTTFELSPDVILDKPFIYFIRAGKNGLVLFAGVVNNPEESHFGSDLYPID